MDQKQQLLKKADELFMKIGIKSVSMDDLARELGMSKKTLYQFVENKSDLIDQIADNHLKLEQEHCLHLIQTSKDAIDEMLGVGRFVITQLRNLSPTTIYDLKKYYRKTWQKFEDYHNFFVYNHIKENIKRGQKEGIYRTEINADIIAKIYVGKSMMIVDEDLFPLKSYKRDELFKEFIIYHLRGISASKGLKLLEKHLSNNDKIKV